MLLNLSRIRSLLVSLIWIGFTAYILWLAPLDQPETLPIVRNLLMLRFSEVNAYLMAIFWMMGVWSLIYGCLMFADGRMQRLPAFLYFLVSNGLGIVGLAPYLALRRRSQTFYGQKDEWLQIMDSHWTGVGLSGLSIVLLGYALRCGDWQAFVHQWQTLPFVHLIALDFCLMAVLFPLSPLLDDDMARRGLGHSPYFWAFFWTIALLPLVGSLLYLCLRPPLPERSSTADQRNESGEGLRLNKLG